MFRVFEHRRGLDIKQGDGRSGRHDKRPQCELAVSRSFLNLAGMTDSAGKQIRDYVSAPSELSALATVEFVVQQAETPWWAGQERIS